MLKLAAQSEIRNYVRRFLLEKAYGEAYASMGEAVPEWLRPSAHPALETPIQHDEERRDYLEIFNDRPLAKEIARLIVDEELYSAAEQANRLQVKVERIYKARDLIRKRLRAYLKKQSEQGATGPFDPVRKLLRKAGDRGKRKRRRAQRR